MMMKVTSGVTIKGGGHDEGAAHIAEEQEEDDDHQDNAFQQGLIYGVERGRN